MKNQKDYTSIGLLGIIIFFLVIGSWVKNFTKFTNCDFQSPYKCEVIHGAGIIPAISVVTVWFNSDEDQ